MVISLVCPGGYDDCGGDCDEAVMTAVAMVEVETAVGVAVSLSDGWWRRWKSGDGDGGGGVVEGTRIVRQGGRRSARCRQANER